MPRPSLDELLRKHRQILEAIAQLKRSGERKEKRIALAQRHLRELGDALANAKREGNRERVAKLEAARREVWQAIQAQRDERRDVGDRISDRERALARNEAKIERARKGALDRIACFDGCAVPQGIRLALLDARENGWNARLNSGDRTPRNCDHCSDKSSQAELYAAYLNGTGAPANPPGGGTHERVNDGTAYPNHPQGKRMPWWGQGIDAQEGAQLEAVLNRLGYKVRRPYSHEIWHLNFVGDFTDVLVRRDRLVPNFR